MTASTLHAAARKARAWGMGVGIAALCWAACGAEERDVRTFTREDTLIERATDVQIFYSDSAVVRVRIEAPVMLNYVDRDDSRQVFPECVTVVFLDQNRRETSRLTARSAQRILEKGLVTARDSVVFQSVANEKIETDELNWNEKTGKIYTEKFVKVSTTNEIIYGYGLEAEQDFSYWKIKAPKGRIKIEDFENTAQ